MRFVQAHRMRINSTMRLPQAISARSGQHGANSAEIVLQWAGSGDLADDSLKDRAKAAYATIADMAARYTRRPDLQRLSAYLARASDDFRSARVHLEAVMKEVGDGQEKERLGKLIAALEADEETKRQISVALATPTPAKPKVPAEPISSADRVDERESQVLRQPHLALFGLAALAERARRSDNDKKIKVALVLGGIEPFEPFGNCIVPAGPEDTLPGEGINTHIQQMASLIATFAPKAQVRAYGAINANGGASNEAVTAAIARAAASDAHIITINIGPLRGADISDLISKATQSGKLVLMPAGNDGTKLDPKKDPVFEGALMVGAWDQTQRARYSNYGTPVTLFAPGRSLAISRERVSETQGTSIAAAIASAVAANVKLLANEPLSGIGLASRIMVMTRKENGQMVLYYQASN